MVRVNAWLSDVSEALSAAGSLMISAYKEAAKK